MKDNCSRPAVILIIDDNPGDVRLMKEAFSDCKAPENLYNVTDGEEAIQFLKKKGKYGNAPKPDIILLDLKLPKISGSELLNKLKKNSEFKQIPIIIFTSSDADADIIKAYNFHANCYIIKPTDFTDLVTVVKTIVEFWLNIVRLPRNE